MSDHIVSAYDDQLNLINTNLIKLGGLVESQLKNAIKSLSDKDTSLADQVVNDDDEVIKKNRLELLQMFCRTFENYINFSKIESI